MRKQSNLLDKKTSTITVKPKLPAPQNSTGKWLCSLFFFFSLGYFLWRGSCPFIVWDDTSSASFNAFVAHRHYSFSTPHFLTKALETVFSQIQGDGYRPLSELIRLVGASYFVESTRSPIPFVGFNAVVTGLLSMTYFSLAKCFVKSNWAALFAVVLFLFSTPVLSASLITFSGIQALVPLVMSAGLLCYFQIVDGRPFKWLWYIFLLSLFLIAPWVREFAGLLPLLIIILELERAKKPTRLMGLGVVFFLHALFPTALAHWLVFPNLEIRPVFAIGNLSAFLHKDVAAAHQSFLQNFYFIFHNLHWRIFIDIVSIYPPTVFLLYILHWKIKKQRNLPVIDAKKGFLWIFFLLAFLPFLKIFNEQVHLAYALMPASILLAEAVEDLWLEMESRSSGLHAKRILVTLCIVGIVSDQTLNVWTVRQVTYDIYRGILETADWFVQHVPQGTHVITNAHHLEDIRFYSHGHIEPWGAPGGIPDQSRWMHNPSDLQKLLDERGDQQVYFFDVEIKNRKGQRGEERVHYYAKRGIVDTEDLGIVHATSFRYPYLDPLKMLIPIEETPWPGPPDLEFDFYRGPALDGTPFLREVYAEYHLYRVTGNKVFNDVPKLLEQNYHGFNLIKFHDHVYAILQSDGAFDIDRIEKKGYSQSFQAVSPQLVKNAIDQSLPMAKNKQPNDVPQLLEQNYHGFNLIAFHDHVYAILQSEGAFDIDRIKKGGYSQSFQAVSPQAVKNAIDQSLQIAKNKQPLETLS